jgi:origin recognition complex subunit 4
LKMAQRLILDRLTGQSRIKLCGHDDQSQKVHQIVEQTVLAGEGNSMLVIGARGSGKTTVRDLIVVNKYANTRQAC